MALKINYLIRLDDACPTMDREKWKQVETILDSYGIQPMVGVIPDNNDPKQKISPYDEIFWQRVKKWNKKGWAIALHGYDHCYISKERGINPLWARSEFAGVPYELQAEKIRKGVSIFREHGVNPKYFFAPSHTFDENTLLALKNESNIRIISDTIATKPYRRSDFIFIPQIGGRCINIPFPGTWTFCLHPSVMTNNDFVKLELFLKSNSDRFISFADLSLDEVKRKSVLSRLLSTVYFTYRNLKGIK